MNKRLIFIFFLTIYTSWFTAPARACGGFFCETVPIDQAGEQIVFHQQGNDITAMVRILYEGDAENFSWVVPVPSTPAISIGDDLTFDRLEPATRPQFQLTREGEACALETDGSTPVASEAPTSPSPQPDVNIEQELAVGPFNIKVVSSENPDAMATWLTDNGYTVTERGSQLIAPYVNDGMKFVAVKLRSGQSTGSIQPLIMRYVSTTPMIPIRLTAIAAQDDMGVLAWVISDARTVPENYLHVTPNYTKLNWYSGPNNAYASYQALITDAMNEAGGQGFATDLAAPIDADLISTLPSAEESNAFLQNLETSDDATFLSELIGSTSSVAFQSKVSEVLPLRAGEDSSLYLNPLSLQSNYTANELAEARASLREAYLTMVIEPVENSTALFEEGRYMTRLYTTLSADEMTVDPVFVYNNQMPNQAHLRQATLKASCEPTGTQWKLTLGEGMARAGETVISANDLVPNGVPIAVNSQPNISKVEITSADAEPQITVANSFDTVQIGVTGTNDDDGGFLGSLSWWWLLMLCLLTSRQLCRRG